VAAGQTGWVVVSFSLAPFSQPYYWS